MQRTHKVNMVFLINFLFVSAIGYLGLLSHFESITVRMVASALLMALIPYIYLLLFKKEYRRSVKLKPINLKSIGLVILLSVTIRPTLTFINAVSMLYSKVTISNVMADVCTETNVFVALIVIAVMPAFFEETVYRGVFFNEYAAVNTRTAVFLSALLFGLMHGNLNQMTYAFVMGILFALMVLATDSVIPSMIIHFLMNGLSVVLLYAVKGAMPDYLNNLLGTDLNTELLTTTAYQLFPSAIVFGFVSFLLLRALARVNGRWDYVRSVFSKRKNPDAAGSGFTEKIVSWPLVAALVLCIADVVLTELISRGIIRLG